MKRKVTGIFGGTFDPIHIGHLILAEQALAELDLESILFVPSYLPPHKVLETSSASSEQRLEMVQIAIASNVRFQVTSLEMDRKGTSYTVDTLEALAHKNPEDRPILLIGSDNAVDFRTWRNPERILELADVAYWQRPGSITDSEIFPGYHARKIEAMLLEISSTELRDYRRNGKSIRYMTPDGVLDYIEDYGLYR